MSQRPIFSWYKVLQDLELTTSLRICMDAGAPNGESTTTWFNLADPGKEFFYGDTVAVEASDPTLVGTIGSAVLENYFQFDGGDWFTYNSSNPAWIQEFHKADAQFTVVCWMSHTSGGLECWLGNHGSGVSGTGFACYVSAADQLRLQINNAGTTVLNLVTAALVSTNLKPTFLAISENETAANAILQIDGTQETFSGAYVSPSSGNATQVTQIGAQGTGLNPLNNTDRMYAIFIWNRALSAAELMSIYQYPGVTFSGQGSIVRQKVMMGY